MAMRMGKEIIGSRDWAAASKPIPQCTILKEPRPAPWRFFGTDGMKGLASKLLPNLLAIVLSVGMAGCDEGGGSSARFGVALILKDASGQPASSFAAGQTITFELTVTN